MARPPRKTDGYRPRPRPARGTRWTDVSVARWALFVVVPATIIALPLSLIAYGIAINLGYNPRRFLIVAATNFIAPGGLGVVLVGLVFGLVKDAKAKHLVALEIDSDSNARLLRARAAQLLRLLARLRRSVHRDLATLREDLEQHMDARIDAAVKEIIAASAATRTGRMWAVPPAAAAPAPPPPTPVPDLRPAMPVAPTPPVVPVTAHDTTSQALAQPTSTRTGSTAAGERRLTPLDPEWRPPAEPERPEPIAPESPRTPPVKTDLDRYVMGETDTFPATEVEDIEGSVGRPWWAKDEESP